MQNLKDSGTTRLVLPSFHTRLVKSALASVLILAAFSLVEKNEAQGIERDSLASENAARGIRGSDTDAPYNLRIGPVNVRAAAGITGSFNDNIAISENGRHADFIVTPMVTATGIWQATDLNTLTFDVGIGYELYTVHSGNSSLILAPDSKVNFNIFVGDVKINLHDIFSYQQDPLSIGQLSNVSQFARLMNDAGLKADWDLGDFIVSLGYDHTNLWVFESEFNYLNYQEDSVSPSLTYKVSSTINTGLAASFADFRYEKNVQNDYTSVSAGPFVNAQISENLSFNAQVGAYLANYDKGGLNGDSEDSNTTYFCSAGVNNRVNDFISQAFTVGRESIPGITSNFTERTYANYSPTWQITTSATLSGNFWWENLEDSNSNARETANRYGAGITFGYLLTDHVHLTLAYQYVLKDANVPSLGYYQNLATIGLQYQF